MKPPLPLCLAGLIGIAVMTCSCGLALAAPAMSASSKPNFEVAGDLNLIQVAGRRPVTLQKPPSARPVRPKSERAARARPNRQQIGVSKVRRNLEIATKGGVQVSRAPRISLSQVEKTSIRETLRIRLPENSLTASEYKQLKIIAKTYNTTLYVIGSRASGSGRNIHDITLPVGKGVNTRSDIDVRIDGQKDIASKGRLAHDIASVGAGAGKSRVLIGEPKLPYIEIKP